MRRIGLASTHLVVALLLSCRPGDSIIWAACARITAPEIDECSGLERSRRYPGVFWVHNDSGDEARIFAIDSHANFICEVQVEGARNVDWEDIASDESGQLYIGDCGNNRNRRQDLLVYVIDEPDPATAVKGRLRVPVKRRLPFRYADQRQFPDSTQLNFDCEAIYWRDGGVYLLTKHRSDLRTALYRLDPNDTRQQVLARLGDAEVQSPVTAADLSADGSLLAVLSYQYILLFDRTPRRRATTISPGRCGACSSRDVSARRSASTAIASCSPTNSARSTACRWPTCAPTIASSRSRPESRCRR